MFLIFDTETTGLPKNYNAPLHDKDNWPRIVQLSWMIFDKKGKLSKIKNDIIKPNGYEIPYSAIQIHGISNELANEKGIDVDISLKEFLKDVKGCEHIVCHNKDFDIKIVGSELARLDINPSKIIKNNFIDTCSETTAELCKIVNNKTKRYKYPKLEEIYHFLFKEKFDFAHNAIFDVAATSRVLFELIRIGTIDVLSGEDKNYFLEANKSKIKKIDIPPEFLFDKSSNINNKNDSISPEISKYKLNKTKFIHIRNKSTNSILESTINIDKLVEKAKKLNMSAVGLIDNNMFGAFNFISKCKKENIKPILGCEFNVCDDMYRKDKNIKDFGYKQAFLAKNINGYNNLIYLSSLSYIDGFYYIPRIDKNKLLQNSSDLICINGGIGSDIYNYILNRGSKEAEDLIKWWHKNFKGNLFFELNRHGIEEQDYVNSKLIEFSKKYNIPLLATNNCYFLDKKDYDIEDIILCIKTNNYKSTNVKDRNSFNPYKLINNEFYFKSSDEMHERFNDIPQSIENTKKLEEKIESYSLERDVILPKFEIPNDFDFNSESKQSKENQYLKSITYKGAKKIYKNIDDKVKERLDFELKIIEKTGYPGYFLLVKEIIDQAKSMGIFVGPGRGSVSGSLVAYCIGITLIDPLEYDLLFERFLNPDRVSMPDVDIDIDNNDRDRLIEWIVERFGKEQVAQIIAYGIIKTKNAIRDTGRVMQFPLSDTDKIAKSMPPEKEKLSLKKILEIKDSEIKKYKASTQSQIKKIRNIYSKKEKGHDVIHFAKELEQLKVYRNITVHACGIIISPDDIKKYIPLTVATEKANNKSIIITQFDKNIVEKSGLLKIDLLGLNNLSIIKKTLEYIKSITKKDIDINSIPLDDKKTLKIFQEGDTSAIFQFESLGMKKYLKQLCPTEFEHLIAMNALYRPGPMKYIPNFIKRKEGKEKVSYDHPLMEKHLKYTYGITVYQEQVMLISQELAGFSKGQADNLRKAIGKKDANLLSKIKPSFFEGCKKNNIPPNIITKVWEDWKSFAEYAFNRSHCVGYTFIAFQTAYLKAHFPLEYMASVMSSVNDEKVSSLLEECKIKKYTVLGPDINESNKGFYVNSKKQIRFGFNAMKGLGESVIDNIIQERDDNGRFESILDFLKRVQKNACNKKALEAMINSGCFDSFSHNRPTLYSNIETLLAALRREKEKNENQVSIFEDLNNSDNTKQEDNIPEIQIEELPDWTISEKSKKEKEIMGFRISGHPLDRFSTERKLFSKNTISDLNEIINNKLVGRNLIISGIVESAEDLISKNGNKWCKFTVDDDTGTHSFSLFGETYLKFHRYASKDFIIFLKIRTQLNKYNQNIEGIITDIGLLEDVIENKLKKLCLDINLEQINDDNYTELNKAFSNCKKGSDKIVFNIRKNFKQKEVLSISLTKNNILLNKDILSNIEKIFPSNIKY